LGHFFLPFFLSTFPSPSASFFFSFLLVSRSDLPQELSLSSCSFSSAAPYIGHLSLLQSLMLEDTNVAAGDISHLSRLQKLRFLMLAPTKREETEEGLQSVSTKVCLSREDMKVIGTFHQLTELHFGDSVFDVKDLLLLKGLTSLMRASIPHVVAEEERAYEYFATLTSLQEL